MLVAEELVLVDTDTQIGHIYAFEKKSGAVRWKYRVPGSGATTDILRHGTNNGPVFALDAETGRVMWQTAVSGRVSTTVLVVDLKFEKELWRHASDVVWSATKSLIFKDRLLTGFKDGCLVAYDLIHGKQSWELKLNGKIRSLNSEGNVLYVGTIAGVVYAVIISI